MLAFGIRYLNGFVAAARPDDRVSPEWPPHPARVYMALAAAHFSAGGDPAERAALLWLEGLEADGEPLAPAIAAGDSYERPAVTHYVPVNDDPAGSNAPIPGLALTRGRQPRTFARAWLADDTVFLVWSAAEPPDEIRAALARLCSKVTRIGHSISLVQMWLAEPGEAPAPTWTPDDERAEIRLRIAPRGTLDELERLYNEASVERYFELDEAVERAPSGKARKAAKAARDAAFPQGVPPRLRPRLSIHQGYARLAEAGAAAPGSVFSPHLAIWRLHSKESVYRALDLCAAPQVAARWREAILSRANDLSAETRGLLAGHAPSGAPLETPHAAYLPLAFTGAEHADGRLVGVAAALPADLERGLRRELLAAFGRVRDLRLGPLGLWRIESVLEAFPPVNLLPRTWTAFPAGAERWATVTPIALDRHPKNEADPCAEIAADVRHACARIGLPEPREVRPTPVSAHLGAPAAHEFPRLRRKDGGFRRHIHAVLEFDERVRGPVLLGAGRYRGYGLCRPLAGAAR